MNGGFEELDLLTIVSLIIGYENLIENRAQNAHNDVNASNSQQAKFLLQEIHRKFDEQSVMLREILDEVRKHENY